MSRAGRIVVILIAGWWLAAGPPLAQGMSDADSRTKPKKSTTGAVLRSMIVPGWGQFYNESYGKAAVFAIGQGSLIYSARHEHFRMLNSQRDGNFPAEKFYRNSRNKLLWWLAGSILLSMGDAYVDAHLYKLDVSPVLDVEEGVAGGVTATVRF